MTYEYCVIGGGIVGLAVARQILRTHRGASLLLIEKEARFATHQTGHNSGVVHAGVYYAPGSLKARLCREGLKATLAFCDTHAIPYETCGKLIVATDADEELRLDALGERASRNGVQLRRISRAELRALEPHIEGSGALLCPETAIVDYRRVAAALVEELRAMGADLRTRCAVERITETPTSVEIGAGGGTWHAGRLIVCGGLQADRLARLAGLEPDFRIIPFRGEYYQLPEARRDLVRHLIYPVPDPRLPFLGIHLTRTIDGDITLGPNAVLGLAREGYDRHALDLRDAWETLSWPGLWTLVNGHRRHTLGEIRNSLSRRAFLAQCRKYCPELALADLEPHPAGIRAQAVSRDGTALHDFHLIRTDLMTHVCNAPSPAATSALPIGRMITEAMFEAA